MAVFYKASLFLSNAKNCLTKCKQTCQPVCLDDIDDGRKLSLEPTTLLVIGVENNEFNNKFYLHLT